MRRNHSSYAAVILALAAASVAIADSQIENTASPALSAAIESVWQEHPELRAARHRLEGARARADAAARPLYNPELELQGERADDDTLAAGISLGIDWAGKRGARRAVGDAEYAAAEADYTELRTKIAADWLTAWAATQAAAKRVALGGDRVLLMSRFAELGERQLRVGDITRVERDLALLAAAEANAQQGDLLTEQAEASRALRSASPGVVAAELLPPLPPVPPSVTEPIRLVDHLPEVLKARAEAAAARARVTVAERDRRPDPTIALRGGSVDTGPDTESLLGLVVSIPLPVRNAFRAEVQAAQADADAAASDLDASRLRATARVEEAETVYRALRLIWVSQNEPVVTTAVERARLLDRLWTAGEISTADYLTQLKQSVDTELAREALRASLWQWWFEYLAASGQIERWLEVYGVEESKAP